MHCTSIVGNWYISNAAVTLANHVGNYSSVFFPDGTRWYGVGTDVEMCRSADHLI